jgi:hypothetical protein
MAHDPKELDAVVDEVATVVSGDQWSWRHADVFLERISFSIRFFLDTVLHLLDLLDSALCIHQSLQQMENVQVRLIGQSRKGCHLGNVVERWEAVLQCHDIFLGAENLVIENLLLLRQDSRHVGFCRRCKKRT